MTMHYRDRPSSGLSFEHVSAPARYTSAPSRSDFYRQGGKRALDIFLVCLGAPLILLVVGIFALLVACNGGQPFYTQTRVGKDRRLYKMWKLRSMIRNADQKLEEHLAANPAARAEWNTAQKLKDDPRITRFGQFLRRSSMDELPQLWNVLRGNMSLVGPRPMMPEQMGLYPGQDYYDMRPGITGSWQVSARNTSSFSDRAKFDASYNQSMSLKEDLRILTATVRVVLGGTGY